MVSLFRIGRLRIIALVTSGLAFLASMSASAGMIRDTEIEAGLRDMLKPLEVAAGYPAGSVDVRVILDPRYNAFVAGKRLIYIHSGLIVESTSSLEAIGVMAHELGHIKEGHVQRISDDLQQASGAAALATVAAIAVAAGGGGGAAAGVLIGGNDHATRGFLASRRRAEAVADEIGLQLLEKTGHSAAGLRDLMQRLARQRSLPESRQSPYYATHPGAAERLQTFQDHLNQSPHSDTAPPPTTAELFARIRAKMVAWTETPQRVKTTEADKAPNETLGAYMHAIADYRRGDLRTALTRMDELVSARPGDPYFHEFRGDILFALARPMDAATSYERALTLRPGSALIQINLGRALIASGGMANLERAITALEAAHDKEARWGFLHRQYGIALGKSGRIAEADLALANEAILLNDGARAAQLARRVMAIDGLDPVLHRRASDIVFRYSKDQQ
ncbi:MAG: M48 family metalloprotease [Rhodobiaceae bacterium]|jgi:predicted Zn-dependent protease